MSLAESTTSNRCVDYEQSTRVEVVNDAPAGSNVSRCTRTVSKVDPNFVKSCYVYRFGRWKVLTYKAIVIVECRLPSHLN